MPTFHRKSHCLLLLEFLSILLLSLIPIGQVHGWSNGGSSTSPSTPLIGTHDWIVEKAVSLLPQNEATIFKNNMNWLEYGTELPDIHKAQGGFGDSFNHHVYFDEMKRVTDDSAATRANETYYQSLDLLNRGNFSGGVMLAGATAHYISDVAVWGHLMGNLTVWGVEKHHGDYEDYVNDHMSLFSVALINPVNRTSAYQATLDLASDIMFNTPNATWMDSNYDWNNQQFKGRVVGSLNLAVNYVANVFHTLWLDAGQPIPDLSSTIFPTVIILSTVFLIRRRFQTHESTRYSLAHARILTSEHASP